MTGDGAARAARWAGWAMAAALGLGLYSHHVSLDRANRRLSEIRPLAERTSVRDRLIGTDLSALAFRRPDGGRPVGLVRPEKTLVWLVDPGECAGCLSDLSDWTALARGGLPTTTVLVNVDAERALRIRRSVDLPGRVAVDPEGARAAALGVSGRLPSLFLLLDSSGTVLMSEARRSDTSCDWSFSGQVAAVTGKTRGGVRRAGPGP